MSRQILAVDEETGVTLHCTTRTNPSGDPALIFGIDAGGRSIPEGFAPLDAANGTAWRAAFDRVVEFCRKQP